MDIKAFLRHNWLYLVGFALYCTMLRQPYFGSILISDLADVHDLRVYLDGVMVLAGAGCMFLGKFAKTDFDLLKAPLVSALLFTTGIALTAITHHLDLSSNVLVFAGVVMLALGFVLLTYVWVKALRQISADHLLPLVMLAFTVSLLTGFADMLAGLAKDAFNIGIALGSIACARLVLEKADEEPEANQLDHPYHITQIVIVLIFVEILCCSLLRGAGNAGGVGYGLISNLQIAAYVVSAIVGLVFFALSVYGGPFVRASLLISGLSLLGLIIIIILFAASIEVRISPWFTSLYSALLVVLISLFAFRSDPARNGSTAYEAGAFVLVHGAISIVSFTAIPRLYSYDLEQAGAFMMPIALTASLAVAIGICAVLGVRLYQRASSLRASLGESASNSLWNSLIQQPHVAAEPISEEEKQSRLIQLAIERYRLTRREAEIVMLFAQGFSIKSTAEALHLAPSTVHSYTKSIYAKLGIHSKDETRDIARQLEADLFPSTR